MADLSALLSKTSRTFALAIPLLPEPTCREVTVAYLLLRIADTLEDAPEMPVARKVAELKAFGELVQAPLRSAAAFCERLRKDPPQADAACLELLGEVPAVLAALATLSAPAQAVVAKYVGITIEGMAATLLAQASDGKLELRSMEELRRYCYIAAGLVGELLTELFLLHSSSLSPVAQALRNRARAFGEGLQLTNILKDETEDAAAGRKFLPAALPRGTVLALARADLRDAAAYIKTLFSAGAPKGFLAFTALPVRLAVETLAAVEARGSGAKVPRERVAEILASMNEALEGRGPLVPVIP